MEIETRQIYSWTVRQRVPVSPKNREVILLLHGWTGDENAMWIFARRLPQNAYLIAPRGLYKIPLGGFGWHNQKANKWPSINDLRSSVEALEQLLVPENFSNADTERFHIIGFSQGAALGFAFGFLYPHKVRSIASLSGFLPTEIDALIQKKPLRYLPVFITHGVKDVLVPVDKARQAVRSLQDAGADVVYCEDDVGHKLSLSCFSSLEHFSALHFHG
jgi:phospholipase/carboxylesterase